MYRTDILLVGVGGYATYYVRELSARGAENGARVVGIVDPYASKSSEYAAIQAMQAPIYDTLDEFYAEHTADLAIIGTPIPLHAAQAIYCMEHGSSVLMEKPITTVVDQAEAIIEARNRTGMKLAVGFQWCYDPAMFAFHKDIRAGVYGKMLAAKAIVLWPRDTAYYHRTTGWAGKKYDRSGNPIFDCVASNATAHYLENILWNAGCDLTDIQVETARANDIETYDTIALQGKAGSAKITYVASHAAGRDNIVEPMLSYVFEKGCTSFRGLAGDGYELVVKLNDGTEKSYGRTRNDTGNNYMHKLWSVVDAIHGKGEIACTAEDALLHTRVISTVMELVPNAMTFPPERIRLDDGMYWVPGLGDTLKRCYETEMILPL